MLPEIKVYRITGKMLLSHDHFPEERVFRMEIPAVSEKDALEKVYSELGSRHKVKRSHIKVIEVKEIPPEQAASLYVKKLLSIGARSVD
jgi:large subunit ribosomal protein LX